MQKKYIGLIIGFVIIVVLSSGCVSNSNGVGNFTNINNTNNSSYSIDGVSFKCPDNWSVSTDNRNGNTSIAVGPETTITSNSTSTDVNINFSLSPAPEFDVVIAPNKGLSDQEAINQVKNGDFINGKKISSNMITIDSKKAYEDTLISDDNAPSTKFEQIYFTKNGNTYLIILNAPENDFNKEKPNFDMILNSFKVQ